MIERCRRLTTMLTFCASHKNVPEGQILLIFTQEVQKLFDLPVIKTTSIQSHLKLSALKDVFSSLKLHKALYSQTWFKRGTSII